MTLDATTRSRIESLLNDNRVVLFMKGQPNAPQCGFSAKAVGILDDIGVAYAHVDVLSDSQIREGIKVYGQWPTIPQLYIGGELVGGSDIIEQMSTSGELYDVLGVDRPDRTPPTITITAAAAQMLRKALDDAGEGHAVQLQIDPKFRTHLQLAPRDANAISSDIEGIPMQFDAGSARRANGVRIDWADDQRGRGLVLDNPNAPAPVRSITPEQAAERVLAGTLTIIDVRPPEERAQAPLDVPYQNLDAGIAGLGQLAKNTPLAFVCHHGGRSQQAAEHFRGLGFNEVYNVDGGIDAWSDFDPRIPRY